MVILIWLVTWLALSGATDRGTFGDMFGGTNALFSGLAFVGLIYAILLQRQELSLQRKELSLTREEISGQRDALEKQNAALESQVFEGTLFQMLGLLNQLTSSIDVTDASGREKRGRDAFIVFIQYLRNHINGETERRAVERGVINFTHHEGAEFWPYVRMFINIIEYIGQIADQDRARFYYKLLRSMITRDESIVLMYNLLLSTTSRPIVERYGLFLGLERSECIAPEHYDLYADSAFSGMKSKTGVVE